MFADISASDGCDAGLRQLKPADGAQTLAAKAYHLQPQFQLIQPLATTTLLLLAVLKPECRGWLSVYLLLFAAAAQLRLLS
jgi:hypothetical protein